MKLDMVRLPHMGLPSAGTPVTVTDTEGRQTRKVLVCSWCQGSPKLDAMRARSKAQAAQLQEIASTPQTGLTSELKVLRMAGAEQE